MTSERPRRRRTVTAVVLALLLALVAAGGAWWLDRATRPDASTAAHPVVRGGELVDSRTGKRWVPRGVTWSSFEHACAQGWGYSALDTLGDDAAIAQAEVLASWGADTVRLLLNQDCWLGTRGAPVGDKFVARTPAGYRAQVSEYVSALNAEGLVVVLTLHSRKRIDALEAGTVAMPDDESIAFWRSVATAYAARPAVLFEAFAAPSSRPEGRGTGFELTWPCWRHGGCEPPLGDGGSAASEAPTFEAQGMFDVVSAIRQSGAPQPILLGGVDGSLEKWDAFAPRDTQLVAALDASTLCPDPCADAVPTIPRAPVLLTGLEPGGSFDRGVERGFDDEVISSLRWAEARGIGVLVGVWAERIGSRAALVTDLRGDPTAWGEVARRWLEDGADAL